MNKQFVFLMISLIWLLPMDLVAQQDPMYSQYQFNALVVNPAYAGSRGMMSMMALSRRQWVGFEGAPSTQTFTMHTPFAYRNVSLGLSVIHDQLSPVSQSAFFGDYAYAFNIGLQARLSMGLKGGVSRVVTNMSTLSPVPGSADPAYQDASESRWLPNFGFGVYAYHPRYFIGVSVPKLMENDLSAEQKNQAILSGREVRHYFFMGGGVFSLNSDWMLKPSFMARLAEAAPVSVDLNVNVLYRNRIWSGVMFRPGSAYGGVMQLQLTDQWRIGYAVEFATSDLRQYTNGTHELMLGYELNFRKGRVYNPRYF
jgi:type IX secretion system PorP/SprF family membrane protein